MANLSPPYNSSDPGPTDNLDTPSHSGQHIQLNRLASDLVGMNPVGSSDDTIENVIALTQTAYDALSPTYDTKTLYVITGP